MDRNEPFDYEEAQAKLDRQNDRDRAEERFREQPVLTGTMADKTFAALEAKLRLEDKNCIAELEAEVARLRENIDHYIDTSRSLIDERDELREALQWLVDQLCNGCADNTGWSTTFEDHARLRAEKQLQAVVARLREANGSLMADVACLRDNEQAGKAFYEAGGTDSACWAALLQQRDEAQAEVARLREECDKAFINESAAKEAARWLYHKHNVPAWDDLESQKHGDQIREDAKKRWRWLEEE